MKMLAGILLILTVVIPGINDIATVNKLKKEAEMAFLAGNYAKAAEAYSMLTDSLGVLEDKVLLNHGHALFQNGDSIQAFTQYQRLINSPEKALRSAALNQMGILSNNPQERASALNFFKEAIKANPANSEARHNYQVLKKQMDEEKDQNKDQEQKDKENQEKKQDEQKDQENKQDQNQNNQDQNQEQQNEEQKKQDQQSQEQKDKEQQDQENQEKQDEKSEEQQKQDQKSQEQQAQEQKEGEQQPPQIDPDKLKEMNISEEKARMILEAMRNSEIQYIQQNKRKGTKKPESSKPDW